jgi:hypothetical protein
MVEFKRPVREITISKNISLPESIHDYVRDYMITRSIGYSKAISSLLMVAITELELRRKEEEEKRRDEGNNRK